MHQNTWPTLLSDDSYAKSFLSDWRNADHSQDHHWSDYEEALNTYLASQDTECPLAVRYSSLIDSRDRFQRLVDQGDTHFATRLALIRIHADLSEHQTSVEEIGRLIEVLPWLLDSLSEDIQIENDRPFLAPLHAYDTRPVHGTTSQWLQAAILEALEAQCDLIERHPSEQQLKRLSLLVQNPNHQMKIDRQWLLSRRRLGKTIKIDDTSLLLNEESWNSEVWRELREKQGVNKISGMEDGALAIRAEDVVKKADALDLNDHDKRANLYFQAIGLDRHCIPAYLGYAKEHKKRQKVLDCYLALKEAERLTALPAKYQKFLNELPIDPAMVQEYLKRSGQIPITRSEAPKRILVITNLFPPQEMGGFGRTMWEFCQMLIQRGHNLRILTADMPRLYRKPSEETLNIEHVVKRNIQLYGDWQNGETIAEQNESIIRKKITDNYHRVLSEVDNFHPEACLLGNLDFIGYEYINPILKTSIPVIHRLGNAFPGYPVDATPQSKLYCMAGATEWLNAELKAKGYAFPNQAVIYPASTLEIYYRYYPPAFDSLRICFAGLLMPYKGPQILLQALIILHRQGIHFSCEFAGDTTNPSFVQNLKKISEREGFSESLVFTGFLNRQELAALYARSNVMVFPSVFDEPFGKSQIEAMAAGLLVITSGTGGSCEIISDGKNGFYFENENPSDLAKKLIFLHHHLDQASQIAAKGQEDAFLFTTFRSVEKIEKTFENLVSANKSISGSYGYGSQFIAKNQPSEFAKIISDSTVLIDVRYLQKLSFSNLEGIAVLMPTIDVNKAQETARILEKRAGIQCRFILIEDTLRQGFVKTINDTYKQINTKYVVYLAEDAFPGRNWLLRAYEILEKTNKGLLSFNDGKWNGKTAAFGMVRSSWVSTLYEESLFFPGYVSHSADDELTILARSSDQFVYDPECLLIEHDTEKDFGEFGNLKDRQLLESRFEHGFDGLVPLRSLNNVGTYHGIFARLYHSVYSDIKIFQIFYKTEQAIYLDPVFEPYDNRDSYSELYEFSVFQELLNSDKVKNVTYWGAVSWKFKEKTGLDGCQVMDFVSNNRDYDLFFFNPTNQNECLYDNYWIHGEKHHPGIIKLADKIFEINEMDSSFIYSPQPSGLFSSANYFIGNKKFWSSYIPFVENILHNVETSLPADLLKILHSNKADPSDFHHNATYIPFVIERLLPLFLHTAGKKLKVAKIIIPHLEDNLSIDLKELRKLKDEAVMNNSENLYIKWVGLRNLFFQKIDLKFLEKNIRLLNPKNFSWIVDLPQPSLLTIASASRNIQKESTKKSSLKPLISEARWTDWAEFLNIFITHSPITDLIRVEWEKHLPNTISVCSRGYKTDGIELSISEELDSCFAFLEKIKELNLTKKVNICIPHSILQGFRLMMEHPIVSGVTYIEEGMTLKKFEINKPSSHQVDKIPVPWLQILSTKGYSKNSIKLLRNQEVMSFDVAHPKYMGCIAAFVEQFQDFPRRLVLDPRPSVVGEYRGVVVVLLPYLRFFNDGKTLSIWLKRCQKKLARTPHHLIVISPHPADTNSRETVIAEALRVFTNVDCMLLSEFKKINGIPAFTETGLIGVDLFLSPHQNSSVLYSKISGNRADYIEISL